MFDMLLNHYHPKEHHSACLRVEGKQLVAFCMKNHMGHQMESL
jgi:hypothetical protein